jgi:hypothetical protein
MTSAEHLARELGIQSRGIHVLTWDNKADLVNALLIVKSAMSGFPHSPTLVPINQEQLQRFGLHLFEGQQPTTMRVFLIPQAATESIGTWLNGWRRKLADPPGTLIVVRHSDLMGLYRRAPDLMSFAQSEVYEATGLLPLVSNHTLEHLGDSLPDGWREPLTSLPGRMPSKTELSKWVTKLRANHDK